MPNEASAEAACEPSERILPQPREAWFTPRWTLPNSAGQAFVAALVSRLDSVEWTTGTRKRARRSTSRRPWQRTVEAMAAGLVKVALGACPGGLAVSVGNHRKGGTRSRYDPPLPPPRRVREVIAALQTAGLVELARGRPGQVSTLMPLAAFGELAEGFGLTLRDVREEHGGELLWLRAPKDGAGARESGEPVEYEDTARTATLRREVEELNAWLQEAELDVLPSGGVRDAVDISQRTMRRVFNQPPGDLSRAQDFALGGRLWGGFWQNMKAEERLKRLRIGGHPIAVVDWSSAWLRVAYGEAGCEPPQGDLYAGLPGYRPGIKAVVSAMLSSAAPLSRYPQGTRSEFPQSLSFAALREAILAAHPPVGFVEGTGFWRRAARAESDALLLAVWELRRQDIHALPLHDALAVAAPHAAAAREAMGHAWRSIVGTEGVVRVEEGG